MDGSCFSEIKKLKKKTLFFQYFKGLSVKSKKNFPYIKDEVNLLYNFISANVSSFALQEDDHF